MSSNFNALISHVRRFVNAYLDGVTAQEWEWCTAPANRPDLAATEYGAARRKVNGKWVYRAATGEEFEDALHLRAAP